MVIVIQTALMTVCRIVLVFGAVMQRFWISIQIQIVMVWVLENLLHYVIPMFHQVWFQTMMMKTMTVSQIPMTVWVNVMERL